MLEAVGGLRVDNFEVRAANVGNAAAAIRGNRRLLLYNPSFMQDIRGATGNPWADIAVMAHEVGHHLEDPTPVGRREAINHGRTTAPATTTAPRPVRAS